MIMTMIEVLCYLFYTSLYASALILIILSVRKISGARLWCDGRMILWLLAVLFLIVPSYSGFLSSFAINNGSFPPFRIRFNEIGILEGDIIKLTGGIEAVLSIWNGNRWIRFTGDGSIIGFAVFSVWFIVAISFILWQLSIYIRLNRKLRGFTPADDETLISYIKSELLFWGIDKEIPVIIAPQKLIKEIKCPSVTGIKNPKIVIPCEQWQQLSSFEKQAVITHELSHIKHNDNLINWFLLLLQAVHWFNPLTWIAFRALRQDLEALRDSNIVKALDERDIKAYANAILNIAGMNSMKYSVKPHSGMLCSSGTGLRIRLIEAKNRKSVIIGIILGLIYFNSIILVFDKWCIDIIGTYITIAP